MQNYVNFMDNYMADILAVCAILFCGLLVCGMICIPFYFFRKDYKKYIWIKMNGNVANGTIIALFHKSFHRSEIDYALYSFTVGEEHTFTGECRQKKNRFYQIGDKIDVYYNPAKPSENCTQRALEDGKNTNRFFIFLLIFMMMVTIISAVVMAVFYL